MQTFPVEHADRIHGFQGRFSRIITKAELKALLGRSASVCENDGSSENGRLVNVLNGGTHFRTVQLPNLGLLIGDGHIEGTGGHCRFWGAWGISMRGKVNGEFRVGRNAAFLRRLARFAGGAGVGTGVQRFGEKLLWCVCALGSAVCATGRFCRACL